MKALLAFLTSCSLAAGIYVGYLEYHRERPAPTPVPAAGRVPPPAPPSTAPKAASPGPAPKVEDVRPAAPSGPDREELAAAVREIEDLLRKEDFDGARKAAEEFLAKHRGASGASAAVEDVRQRTRKIEAYRAIISSLEQRELPEVLYEVDLESGGRFTAKSRKETAERWDFEHVLGGVSSHRKTQVSSIRPIPRKQYLDARWKEIQASVKDRTDPYDIYFFGVKKCFRDGLRREGIELLDRLLAMADSASLVAIIKDPAIAQAWEDAGGRDPVEAGGSPASGPVVAVRPAAGPAEPPPPTPPPDEPGEEEIDVEALTRAEQLVVEAEGIFAAARGSAEKLFDARIRLQSAAKLLYGLQQGPFDPRIGQLNRRARDLLEKVMGEKE